MGERPYTPDELRKRSVAVHLAIDATEVADEISGILLDYAAAEEGLTKRCAEIQKRLDSDNRLIHDNARIQRDELKEFDLWRDPDGGSR